MCVLDVFWTPFLILLDALLETSWGPLGYLLGTSGGLLDFLGNLLGLFDGFLTLGASDLLGASWGPPGKVLAAS